MTSNANIYEFVTCRWECFSDEAVGNCCPLFSCRPLERSSEDVDIIFTRLKEVKAFEKFHPNLLQQICLCGYYENLEKGITCKRASCDDLFYVDKVAIWFGIVSRRLLREHNQWNGCKNVYSLSHEGRQD